MIGRGSDKNTTVDWPRGLPLSRVCLGRLSVMRGHHMSTSLDKSFRCAAPAQPLLDLSGALAGLWYVALEEGS